MLTQPYVDYVFVDEHNRHKRLKGKHYALASWSMSAANHVHSCSYEVRVDADDQPGKCTNTANLGHARGAGDGRSNVTPRRQIHGHALLAFA